MQISKSTAIIVISSINQLMMSYNKDYRVDLLGYDAGNEFIGVFTVRTLSHDFQPQMSGVITYVIDQLVEDNALTVEQGDELFGIMQLLTSVEDNEAKKIVALESLKDM